MGILNVTPDSFSDGGRWMKPLTAIRHGIEMAADIVDVGGESTRPGAPRVDPIDEQARVIPVIAQLASRGVRVSVDTMNASTAARALDAGALIVNDVSGGLADPDILRVVAERDAHYIAMHWRGHSTHMNDLAVYGDVVAEVRDELSQRVDGMRAAGIRDDRIILDPGLGFAKTAEHNWALLANPEPLESLGFPILIGHSRKRFLAPYSTMPAPAGRDEATAMLSLLSARRRVWGVRVHDVASSRLAVELAERMREAVR
ncbi:dihydropteroate synthase [Microbacteriaceae bacterium VKM Ac-2855]|nr:dihydropteroate synthase [Microbacteriaceae bacterium VKM Ac-2855]